MATGIAPAMLEQTDPQMIATMIAELRKVADG